MAEQFLHASQVGAIFEQVCCEAVAQCVRADGWIESDLAEILVELAPDGAGADSSAMLVDEEGGVGFAFAPECAEAGVLPGDIFVMSDGRQRVRSDGDQSFFFAFPTDEQRFVLLVEITDVDVDEFGDADAS